MYSHFATRLQLYAIVLWSLNALTCVRAAIYVNQPLTGNKCSGGKPCTVTWLDDGIAPLLTTIGVTTVGLYTGEMNLVQQISPVNVASVHSLQFTPDPKVGPNSKTYYIAFTSTTYKVNGTTPYVGYSPSFTLDNMQGSFSTHIASATSTIPIPSTVVNPSPTSITSTVIVGTLSTTSLPLTPSTILPSGFSTVTSIRPSSTLPSSSASTSATSSTSSATTLLLPFSQTGFLPALSAVLSVSLTIFPFL